MLSKARRALASLTRCRLPRWPPFRSQAPLGAVLAAAPPALLAYWGAGLDELRLAAGVALASTVVLLLGAQQSQKASRSFI